MSSDLRKRARRLLRDGSLPELGGGEPTGMRLVSETTWQSAVMLAESFLSTLRFQPRSAWKPDSGPVVWWRIDSDAGPVPEMIGTGAKAAGDYLWWTPINTPSTTDTSSEMPVLE